MTDYVRLLEQRDDPRLDTAPRSVDEELAARAPGGRKPGPSPAMEFLWKEAEAERLRIVDWDRTLQP